MDSRNRLRSSRELTAVLRTGASVARPELVVYYSMRAGGGRSRFGFVVSRRVGGAVSRNRVKRLLREASRSLVARLKVPVDLVVVAREPILEVALSDLRAALDEAATRAGLVESQDHRS